MQTVGALWTEVLIKPELLEHCFGINGQYRLGGCPGIHLQQDSNEPADNKGVAVTPKNKFLVTGNMVANQPNLTNAALHFHSIIVLRLAQGVELLAKLDHVFVAIFPVVEITEVVYQVLNGHRVFSFV